MGTYCSSANNNRGQTDTMNLLILLTALAGVALAEPWGYYGYPYYHHQLTWPSVSGPGFTSTVFGLRGKRSADPEPFHPFYGFYGYPHPYYVRPVVGPVAAPEGTGVAGHPGYATSFVSRSPQGAKAKRSAEPYYGYYGHPYGYYGHPYLFGRGVAGHPGGATSHTYRSPQGLGK